MNPERWQKAKDICFAVLDRPADERSAALLKLCAGDDELRRDVEVMIADAVTTTGAQTAPARAAFAPAGAAPFAAFGPDGWMPESVGDFRILRIIGEGGMGVVYEARQHEPNRIVALKVIRPGLATPEVLRRFRQEAQALGRLQHPGIAQIYEAGTAETTFGPQPYFAMEFIRGHSLRAYVEQRQPSIAERLELVARICDAVQHAHQRGLIHRDLKPSNILVDDTGQPKILDFGVARLTERDVQVTRLTDLGQLIGTLAYMSPEQVLADPLELDTRSDVYALGVIFYELLAGRLPYSVGTRIDEAVRTIKQEDPQRLSSISRAYRGDLETIAAKALEKDKTRRYGSASALAADIRRYLHNEPISARPASASYQLQKFVRRHRALVTGAAVVLLALAVGIVATAREAIRARRAERAALAAEDTAQAINDFLRNDVLAQASAVTQARPDTKTDPDLKVRTALDRAAATIGERFQSRPLVEASVRQTIGDTYRDLGLYPEAIAQFDRALALRRGSLGTEHADTLETMHQRGFVLSLQAKYAEAEQVFDEVLAAQRRVLGEAHPQSLMTMNSLAMLHYNRGEHAKAEPLLVQYLDAMRRLHGAEHRDTAQAMNDLAGLYKVEGKYKDAEPLYVTALSVRERIVGVETPETLASMNDLAHLYRLQNRYKEAEPLYVRSVELKRKLLGNDHSETAIGIGNLGNLYMNMGDYARAEPLLVESMETRRRIWGEDHPDTATGINNLAGLYSAMYRRSDALWLYGKALAIRRRTLGNEHVLTLQSLANLAVEHRIAGKYEEAEALLVEAFETTKRVYGADHVETMYKARALAAVYRVQGKFALAQPLALSALEGHRQALGDDHAETITAEEEVAALDLARDRLDDALRRASRALGVRRKALAPTHNLVLRAVLLTGRVHLKRREYVEAERLFREASAGFVKVGTDKWRPALTDSLLARALAAQGKRAEAEPLLESACRRLDEQQSAIPRDNSFLVEEARKALAEMRRASSPRR